MLNKEKINEVALKNSLFSAPRYSIIAEYLLDNNFKNVYLTSNGLQSLEMLFSGRINYILASEHSLKIEVKKLNPHFSTLTRVLNDKIVPSSISIAFNRSSDVEMVKHFQQAFLEIKKNGTLAKVTEKWHIAKLNSICY